MKRTFRISLALSFMALAPSMLAQDAAAPFRRTSPTPAPAEEATPAPEREETPREEERQEPREAQREEPREPQPTEEEPRRAEPAPTPAPPAQQETAAPPESTASPAARSSRRVLQGEPVRAVEPRSPGARTPRVSEPQDDPNRREGEPPRSERKPDDEPARREAARTPAKRRRSADRDPAPARAPQPNRAALDYWDEDPGSAVKALERKWQRALVDKDVGTINDLLAGDFVATSSTGRVGSKSAVLNAIRRDKNKYTSANARGMSVRMLGPRVAVVTGVATESGTTPDGRSFRNSRRFTDTWMLRNGKWVCVASQATEVPNS
jgi:ketosteroid isomerase-like protein